MLDTALRRYIDPPVNRLARRLSAAGIPANATTAAGLALGLAGAGLIALGLPLAGLALFLLSRLADGLDGAVARHRGQAGQLGGFLDIVFDFAVYGAIPVAFAIQDPAQNAVAAAVLVATFYVNGGSVLAYAVMAEQRGLETQERGGKALLFTAGLAEASETILAVCLFCLLPGHFPLIAYAFAALTAATCAFRIRLACRRFD